MKSKSLFHVPVQIPEKGNEVEGKLKEALLFVLIKRPEDFCCIVHVGFVEYPSLALSMGYIKDDQRGY
jgi:hypothetical protein